MTYETELVRSVVLDYSPLQDAAKAYCDDRSLSYLEFARMCQIPLPNVLHFLSNGDASGLNGADVVNLCRATSVPMCELEVCAEGAE